MQRRSGGRGETLANTGVVLDTLGRCRRTLIEAQDGVKPFGTMYHACAMVLSSIDALAYRMTGRQHFFDIDGSVPPAGAENIVRAKPRE